MKVLSSLVGAAIFGASAVSLPAMVGVFSGHEDLRVQVHSPRRYEVRPSPDARRARVAGTEPEGVRFSSLLRSGASGVDLTTWRTSYGSAYEREVTWPALVGPFNAEDDYVCGYTLWLGAGLFDTSDAGAGLSRLVRAILRSSLPKSIDVDEYNIHVKVPDLRDVKMEVVLEAGRLTFSLTLDFQDRSRFAILAVPVRIDMNDGAPVLKRDGRVGSSSLTGPLREELLRQGGNEGAARAASAFPIIGPLFLEPLGREQGISQARSEIPVRAAQMAENNVDEALANLALGLRKLREPWRPLPSRRDEIRLKLASAPVVAPGGIRLDLCARVSVAEPKMNPVAPGSVAIPNVVAASSPSSGPSVGVALAPAAINQVLYYLWQSGQLAELGRSKSVFDALDEGVRLSALDFKGFSPGLPPALAQSSRPGRLSFVVGDVALGGLRDDAAVDVVAHGQADLVLANDGDNIRLEGFINDLRLNCVGKTGSLTTLTPCLGDLLPLARKLATKRRTAQMFAGADLLAKLPAIGFRDAKLKLSQLHVATAEAPPTINLSVEARFE